MQTPRHTSARQIGPYFVVTRLDPAGPDAMPVPERRYIARSADGNCTVLLSLPLADADPERFLVEAQAARTPLGPWTPAVTDCSTPGPTPWCARAYEPVLPLPTVLAVHGGPLPDETLRALGSCLAETLVAAHSRGATHAGLSPAAVLLAGDGPRVTCSGAARTAAPDGKARSGLPGLEAGSLSPEQASGGRPRPPGDVYALGAVLAYAATGHTVPDREELPFLLRSLVPACLARDPAARPRAIDVLQALAPSTSGAAPSPTVIDPGSREFPLPGRVIAALARQSAEILAADLPLPLGG
ncbi:serine/threonine protein kinase [Streptomyces sp. NBC_01591]|uniref:serine/threonine protein kinase n=1 Tax=Streptomyces sp. NBC_01591 TaxID=2975888 RepID=UPI002DD8BD19|nr:serine/threonine protein kinase [Streptomyces sp. NBC_01591]WSD68746.1 serine/threonine protein kinase [Streptomyces sp. NBC_01591]